MFWFLDHETCGILAPQPGAELSPPALEGKVSTTGPPGKFLTLGLLKFFKEYFGHRLCGMLAPHQELKVSPSWKRRVLTTGAAGKSLPLV